MLTSISCAWPSALWHMPPWHAVRTSDAPFGPSPHLTLAGQKELAGAYIDANDLCPPKPAAPGVQPATPERSGSALGRLFRSSASSQPAPPPPAAACTPVKYCDKLPAVIQRCKWVADAGSVACSQVLWRSCRMHLAALFPACPAVKPGRRGSISKQC